MSTSTTSLINCTAFTSHSLNAQLCAICLDLIPPPSTTHTPCASTFCTPCLSAWVTARLAAAEKATCPTCRGLLVTDEKIQRPGSRGANRGLNPRPSRPADHTNPHQHPQSDPLLTSPSAFSTQWRTIASAALPLPHLNALLSLLGPETMATHFQPSPIPRIANSLLTRLYDSGLMDLASQSRCTQLEVVANHGTREWGLFSFPAANRAEELGAGEAQRRYFFVPMRLGGERNGEFIVWNAVGRKKTGCARLIEGWFDGSKKAVIWKDSE